MSRTLLGTVVTITISSEKQHSADAFAAAFSEIENVQKELSLYDPESEISRLNKTASLYPFKVSSDTFLLLSNAVEISVVTDGAFDVTFASAGNLWDFSDPEKFTPPDDAEVRNLLPLISYKNIKLDPGRGTVRFLKQGTKVGLGGIAKGYAVTKAVAALKSRDVKDAIVACAGDIQVIGSNRGRPWRAGIRDPRGQSVFASLDMYDGDAVSTSGDYERFRIVNGRRYHHIIDPKTGYPADSGLISVSVFSKDPVLSDAYSTAFFVCGFEQAKRILENVRGLSVVFVTSDMRVFASESMKGRITFREGLEVIYF